VVPANKGKRLPDKSVTSKKRELIKVVLQKGNKNENSKKTNPKKGKKENS